MPKLNPMSTAPKDRYILIEIPYEPPFNTSVAIWSEHDDSWVFAIHYSHEYGGKKSMNFKPVIFRNPKGWYPMPEIERKKK